MNRRLVKTEDGSHTLFVPELGEHYHSIHGAVQESEHIYIRAGFLHSDKDPVRVLEYGMGTGLNVLLTYIHAARTGRQVVYHAVEKYPVTSAEKEMLNLSRLSGCENPAIFDHIHACAWGEEVQLGTGFRLYKEKSDFRQASPGAGFDVIYFDAFAPEVQPELWSAEMFSRIFAIAAPGAILTTYSSRGQVRRHLQAAGFRTEKIPGPPGKREITRAVKNFS